MKKCSRCEEASHSIFIFNGSKQLCRDCWVNEKIETKKLIRKLPLVQEKEAPLGYNLVWFEYYVDTGVAKTQANILYKYNKMGMVN
jgi:hypothetical protein